ncbi:VanZ family protein [Shewanella subflava]|uniref:VanZ family protein n=1 Tax=Shewanella subflava TaxID=2986476 RepID=A0ABT3IB86_9GAMM|nr:VanZ family protein [Shewanella subflava]MCW3173311.1 VanZ family protein [Shewanella subflava]
MLSSRFYVLSVLMAGAFLGFIIWIIYLANTGASSVFFDLIKHIPYGDKVGHCLLFGTLTFLANLTLKFNTITLGRVSAYIGSCLVAVFVLVEEISQGFIPSRTLDGADLLADALGIALFSYFSWLTHRFILSSYQGKNHE